MHNYLPHSIFHISLSSLSIEQINMHLDKFQQRILSSSSTNFSQFSQTRQSHPKTFERTFPIAEQREGTVCRRKSCEEKQLSQRIPDTIVLIFLTGPDAKRSQGNLSQEDDALYVDQPSQDPVYSSREGFVAFLKLFQRNVSKYEPMYL